MSCRRPRGSCPAGAWPCVGSVAGRAPRRRPKTARTRIGRSAGARPMAERRFPVRIRIGVPPGGLGRRHPDITAWLDENCGAAGWAMTPSGVRGVLNDAVSIYFLDPTLAGAFVARWCAGARIEVEGGVFRTREDEPTSRFGAAPH